jgi:hypothetical protein
MKRIEEMKNKNIKKKSLNKENIYNIMVFIVEVTLE